jgi:hypothetical protein
MLGGLPELVGTADCAVAPRSGRLRHYFRGPDLAPARFAGQQNEVTALWRDLIARWLPAHTVCLCESPLNEAAD